MAVVSSFNGSDRHIHLLPGLTSFHPIDDIYREYRTERRTNEAFRKWEPFMYAPAILSKGGGKFTPRFLVLLNGAKIVLADEAATVACTGEVITDDETDPFDYSLQTTPSVVRYQPAEAELITISGGGISQDQMNELIGIIMATA